MRAFIVHSGLSRPRRDASPCVPTSTFEVQDWQENPAHSRGKGAKQTFANGINLCVIRTVRPGERPLIPPTMAAFSRTPPEWPSAAPVGRSTSRCAPQRGPSPSCRLAQECSAPPQLVLLAAASPEDADCEGGVQAPAAVRPINGWRSGSAGEPQWPSWSAGTQRTFRAGCRALAAFGAPGRWGPREC